MARDAVKETSLPSGAAQRKLISIVTPVYNEEQSVRRCYEEVRRIASGFADRYDYEHIFGDNHSEDGTLSILREIAASDPHVRVLAYSRNFGAEKSGMTLLRHASGDASVGVMCDLQEPPSLIPRMLELWEKGFQVVYGVYRNPNEGPVMRVLRRAYYALVDGLSPEPLPRGFTGFSLLDRQALDELIRVDDHSPYIRGIIATIGFRQIEMPFERAARLAGSSKHGFRFLFEFGLNGIISHSTVPIRVASYAGAVLAGGSVLAAFAYLILKLLNWNIQAPGATSIIILVLFFSGVQLLFLGTIGEYVGAIHAQVRRRPFVIVEEAINFPARSSSSRPVPEPALQPKERLRRTLG